MTNERDIGLVSGPVDYIMTLKIDNLNQVRHTLEIDKACRTEIHQQSLAGFFMPRILSSGLGGNRLVGSRCQVIQVVVEYHQQVTFSNTTPSLNYRRT